jgi:uncharacterized membrane protein
MSYSSSPAFPDSGSGSDFETTGGTPTDFPAASAGGSSRPAVGDDASAVNVAPVERAASALAGIALGWYAITRRNGAGDYSRVEVARAYRVEDPTAPGSDYGVYETGAAGDASLAGGETRGGAGGDLSRPLLLAAAGYLLYRGASGNCPVYSALRTGSAQNPTSPNAVIPHGQGVKVDKVVTIGVPVEKVYSFWRDFTNLPRFMKHLESVTILDGTRSAWTAKAPLGQTVSWHAEIIADQPNELIAWKSVEPHDIPNAGSVRFRSAPAGRGTVVEVTLEYNPPGGILGATVAKLFGEEPGVQVEDDLRRFKQIMETGEIARNGHAPEDRTKAATGREVTA